MYVGDELSGKRVYGDAPPLPVNQAEFSKFNSKYRGKKMTVLKFSSRGGFREATFLIEGNGKYLAYTSSCGKLWRRSYVPFANMTHLQPGQHAANFQPCIEEFRPANRLSFSIYFKGLVERNSSSDKESVLSIICQDQEQYDRFYGMVRGVMENIAFKKSLMNQHALYLEKMWDDADKHGTGKLSLYQIGGMCAKMNIDLPAASIKRKFDETDIDGSTFIEKDEFPFFIDSLCYRSDLQYIWEAIMRLAPEHDVQIDRLDAAGNPIFGAFLLPDSRVTGSSVGSAHTNGGKMSLQRFHQFLLNIQHEVGPSGEPITLEEARELVYDVMKIMGTQARGYVFDGNNLPYEVFRDYLSCSTLNEALNPQHGSVFQDMTQPLSAYFIASSHNTYLEGDQWRSSSSTQRYISDLLSCCRCVELDCWDGSNGEPIITHGHTATGVISFRDAIIAINEYAFRESPYPVVLSIEQHCSEIQIEMQVRIMKEIFEEKILIATAPGTLENLPSPAELRHKIIIKGKRGAIEENNDEDNDEEQEALAALQKVEKKSTDDLLKNLHWSHISNRLFEHHSRESRLSIMPTSLSPSVTGGSNGSGGDSPLMPPPPPLDSFRLIRTPHSLSGAVKQALAVKSKSEKKKLLSVTDKHDSVNSASSADSSSSRSANAGSAHSSSKREGRHAPVHAAIQTDTMSPITFLGTTSKVSKFALASMALPCDLMSSYSETTAQAYVDDATKLQGWIEHNTNHLSRIYPKGIRVDSSNYMPTTAWGAGAQLVALNYQTSDDGMFANFGMFRQNGHCGYVLKPAYLRPAQSQAQNQTHLQSIPENAKTTPSAPVRIQLHIMGGAQIPKPGGATSGEIIDPFLLIDINGVRGDSKRYTTSVVNNNGFSPMWNEVVTFTIQNPDIAILTIKVMDSDQLASQFIAYCSYAVSALRHGVRLLQLRDSSDRTDGDFSFAKLYVRISITPVMLQSTSLAVELGADNDESDDENDGSGTGTGADANMNMFIKDVKSRNGSVSSDT